MAKAHPVRQTSKSKLKQIDFRFEDRQLRGLEQNPNTKSRWSKMAREGKRLCNFWKPGRYVAVVVDGKAHLDEQLRLTSFRPSLQYGFVRGRQLEGTFPGDRQTGVWPITGHRVSYGWGGRRKKTGPILRPVLFGLRLNPQVLILSRKNIASFRTSVFALLTTANAFFSRASRA